MCYYIIQNIIETIRHLVPRLHLQRFGRWSLGTNTRYPGTSAPAHGMPLHQTTVSRGQIMAPAPLRDRPGRAESREGGSIWKFTWPKTLTACNEQISHAFSSRGFILCRLADPRPRIRLPDSASLRSFAVQRYMYLARCVAPRDLGLLIWNAVMDKNSVAQSTLLDPRSSIYVPRSSIYFLDPRSTFLDPRSTSLNPRSTALDPRSTFFDPRSTSLDPRSPFLDLRSTFVDPPSSSMFPDHRCTFLDPPSTFLGPILDTRLPSQCRLLDPDLSPFYFAHAQSEPRSSSPETEAAIAEAALNSARETLKRARQRFHSTAIATEQNEQKNREYKKCVEPP